MFKLKEERILEYANMATLLYMKVLQEGCPSRQKVKHLQVDEMQDYSVLQYKLLTRIFNWRKTILGDAQQSANPLSSTDYERIRQNTELEVIERHGDQPVCYTLYNEELGIQKMCDIVCDFSLPSLLPWE